jgi:hypothetical protein
MSRVNLPSAEKIGLAFLWDENKRKYVLPERFEDISPSFLALIGEKEAEKLRRVCYSDSRDK